MTYFESQLTRLGSGFKCWKPSIRLTSIRGRTNELNISEETLNKIKALLINEEKKDTQS